MPCEPAAPSIIRRQLSGWLASIDWPLEHAQDLVLAVSEAASNSVEHGYRGREWAGPITVTAEQAEPSPRLRRIRIVVADRGSWRPIPAQTNNRRRGLPLMRALTENIDVVGTPDGTRVTMISRLVARADTPAKSRAPSTNGSPPADGS